MEKMEEWRKGGVNRISIGVQSLREKSLEYLGRKHTAGMAKEAIKRAKDIFPFVSFDLIYAMFSLSPFLIILLPLELTLI